MGVSSPFLQALARAARPRNAFAPPEGFSTVLPETDRIEDDRTGERQSGSPSSDQGAYKGGDAGVVTRGSLLSGGRYDTAQMHPFDSARYPLEQQISSDKNEYNRLVAPPPPLTISQRIRNVISGAAEAGRFTGPAAEQWASSQATLRDRAAARKLQEQEGLGARIDANQRALAQQGLGEERVAAARQSLSDRLAMQDMMNRERIAGSMARTEAQQTGAGQRTAEKIGSQESIAAGRRGDVRVFGNRSYERIPGADPLDPSQDTWRDVGAAPPQATREQGNYLPVPDPNNPNQIAGYVNPKARHFVGIDQIQGITPATTPGAAPGAAPTIMSKVTGQTKSRADAAASIMPLIQSVRQQLDDPDIQKNLGVLAGNWNEVQRRAAGAMPDLTPVERQKVRRFAGTLTSIYSLGGTMHGWRALQVAKEFESRYGGIPAGQSELLGSMQALEETANSVARTGGYGQGAAPGAPPPAGGGQRISLKDFLEEK